MKENYKSATHIGDVVVGIHCDTKVFQKQLKAISNHARELAGELEAISKEDVHDVLANYSTDELLEEVKRRAIKLSGSVTEDVLKLSNDLKLTITRRIH
ncbi:MULTISPECIES: hypothetical protein [Bacillus cereus group]|uniref:hypothetical protein n=1 Tax=Bacillus cereus group TaxID=86661 RepID=UPI001AED7366|nr:MULTISPECIES: hypothetical protein [Bacillus cereus group]QTR79157.1 hypothetical protein JC773_00785 [Bacillus cytotoxicus]